MLQVFSAIPIIRSFHRGYFLVTVAADFIEGFVPPERFSSARIKNKDRIHYRVEHAFAEFLFHLQRLFYLLALGYISYCSEDSAFSFVLYQFC
ncbi:hypothetical protein ES703_23434 [subsurface metagenome]